MRRHRRSVAVLGTAIGVILMGMAPARAAIPVTPKVGASIESDEVIGGGGRLHAITLYSSALGADTNVRVMLPKDYDSDSGRDRRYSVLVLLHGAGGDESNWTKHVDLAAEPSADDLIIVMPEGGQQGFYSDWKDGPQWESYHVGELVPWVDATYRTFGDRAHRGIAGLSMGGYGALEYASRHPDLFVATASFSGAADITFGGSLDDAVLSGAGVGDDRRWGTYDGDPVTWHDHNPADLMGNLGPVRVALYCGNGFPNFGDNPAAGIIELGAYGETYSYHSRAEKAGVEHEYHSYGAGTHEWSYWKRDLQQWLPTLLAIIASPPPVPDTFDYRSAESHFGVWGWSVSVERTEKASVSLTHVSARGLDLDGTGTFDIVTAPLYAPGAAYLVAGGDGERVVADTDGRVELHVSSTGLTHIAIDAVQTRSR